MSSSKEAADEYENYLDEAYPGRTFAYRAIVPVMSGYDAGSNVWTKRECWHCDDVREAVMPKVPLPRGKEDNWMLVE